MVMSVLKDTTSAGRACGTSAGRTTCDTLVASFPMHCMPSAPMRATRLIRRCAAAVILTLHAAAPGLRAQTTGASSANVAAPSTAPTPGATVDHQLFDALLRRHVVDGFVDYAAFAHDPTFAQYLSSLNTVRITTLDTDERLAFWINVYNAFTIQLVASRGETESMRNIEKTFGVLQLKGPWSTPIVRAAGRTLTLDDVEHTIIRKQFSDPRIHFALVYAAVGSPPLRSEAYSGARLDEQLDDQARRFLLASPTKNRLDQRGFRVALSPIFTYYRADFGSTRPELGGFLAQYADSALKSRLEKGAFASRETRFDWTLNSQAKGRLLAAQALETAKLAARDSLRDSSKGRVRRD